jgi:hypothetical protein
VVVVRVSASVARIERRMAHAKRTGALAGFVNAEISGFARGSFSSNASAASGHLPRRRAQR